MPNQELDPPKLLEQNFDMFIKRNSEPSQGSDVVIEAACNSDDYNLPQEEQLFEQLAYNQPESQQREAGSAPQ